MMLAGEGTGVNDRSRDLEDSGSHHGARSVWSPAATLWEAYFQKSICPAEGRRQPGHQVLAVDGLSRVGLLFLGQDARQCRNIGPGHFSPDRAGSHRHLRIVANTLRLAHLAEGHHVKLVAVLAKPYRCRDLCPILAECAKRNVFLIVDCGGDWLSHGHILAEFTRLSRVVRLASGRLIPPSLLC